MFCSWPRKKKKGRKRTKIEYISLLWRVNKRIGQSLFNKSQSTVFGKNYFFTLIRHVQVLFKESTIVTLAKKTLYIHVLLEHWMLSPLQLYKVDVLNEVSILLFRMEIVKNIKRSEKYNYSWIGMRKINFLSMRLPIRIVFFCLVIFVLCTHLNAGFLRVINCLSLPNSSCWNQGQDPGVLLIASACFTGRGAKWSILP